MTEKNEKQSHTCVHCKSEYLTGRSNQRFCSEACQKFSHRYVSLKERDPCPVCKKKFESRNKKIYCSMECYKKSPKNIAALMQYNTERKKSLIEE